jgi:hypothetical protein
VYGTLVRRTVRAASVFAATAAMIMLPTGAQAAKAPAAPGEIGFSIITLESAANGNYVSVDGTRTGRNFGELLATGTEVTPAEQFNLQFYAPTGAFLLQSRSNGLFVSAELGYTGANYGELRARSLVVGGWEQFNLLPVDTNGDFVLQSVANNEVVTVNSTPGRHVGGLRANGTVLDDSAKFRLDIVG